jgi:protein-S-isoprenylcysteine O-methyltransferase Ste14
VIKERSGNLVFGIAGLTFVLCWLLFALFFHNPASQTVFVLGNALGAVGILLIVLAMNTLRRRGEILADQDFTSTTLVVKQGVYSLVRHPLYLGWLLAYPAAMLVSQHWLIVVLGAIGMASIVQITRLADGQLIAKFGSEYEMYIKDVPPLNIILGIGRRLKREVEG